jgi:hypothetical protein
VIPRPKEPTPGGKDYQPRELDEDYNH